MRKNIIRASIIGSIVSLSLSAQNKMMIPNSKIVQFEIHSEIPIASIYAIDETTGKKAKINMIDHDSVNHVSTGFAILRFSPTPGQNSAVKILNNQFKPMTSVTNQQENTYHLFETPQLAQKYAIEKQNELKQIQEKKIQLDKISKMNKEKQEREFRAMQLKLEEEREKERLAKEASEAMKRAELIKEQEKLTLAEKNKRIQKAQELATQAMAEYKNKNFKSAENLFEQSINLDPTNNKYYFQYGICLYKNEKYEKSLVALSIADSGDFQQSEKYYYTGLSQMKLKEFNNASENFIKAEEENDIKVSPMAAFLNGLIYMQNNKTELARTRFEYVVDHSQDPSLDKEAEKYLEELDAIDAFNQKKAQKWNYSFFIGPQYDTNILNISTQSSPLNVVGFRAMYGGNLEYRPVYTYQHEFSVNTSVADIYTVNSSFQPDATLQKADPLQTSISLPYKYKTKWGQRPYQLGIIPGYEIINMNVDGVGIREQITNTYYLRFENSLLVTNDLNSKYSLEYRNDGSLLTATSTAEDQNATKITFSTNQVYYINPKKTKNWLGDFTYVMNQAKGSNQSYNKITLAAGYAMDWKWNSTLNYRFEYSIQQYPTHSSSRSDSSYSLNGSASKPLSKSWSTGLSLTYSANSSNISSNSYNKINISNVYTYTGAF